MNRETFCRMMGLSENELEEIKSKLGAEEVTNYVTVSMTNKNGSSQRVVLDYGEGVTVNTLVTFQSVKLNSKQVFVAEKFETLIGGIR